MHCLMKVLIRYLTYWSEAIDSRKYVVESDLSHEEWYTDCCNYAASETDEERYMHAKCMTEHTWTYAARHQE